MLQSLLFDRAQADARILLSKSVLSLRCEGEAKKAKRARKAKRFRVFAFLALFAFFASLVSQHQLLA
jgi:hypothetical protein